MIVPKLHYFCYFRPCIVRDIQTEKLKVLSNQSILFGFPPLGGFRYLLTTILFLPEQQKGKNNYLVN